MLNTEQIAAMEEWLRAFDPCPWCDAERPWPSHVDQPITHRADCLLALIAEADRDGTAIRLGAIAEEAGSPEAIVRHKSMRNAARSAPTGEAKSR